MTQPPLFPDPIPTEEVNAIVVTAIQAAESDAPDHWTAIPLGAGVTLLIDPAVHEKTRDRTDWIVRWAKKVYS